VDELPRGDVMPRKKTKPSKLFTPSELKKFDGVGGKPAYVAFQGKIYDVSKSKLWVGGKHQTRHIAGDDLTEHLTNAPHKEEVLVKFPVVGELIRERGLKARLGERIEKLHLHPIIVHFAIAYSMVVSLLVLLFYYTGQSDFEVASYYLLILGFLSSFPAGLSGLIDWRLAYEGRRTRTFSKKIGLTVILIILITMTFLWRTLDPSILIGRTIQSYAYTAMIFGLVPTVVLLGYYGGKIVYG
jgi:predicted heme/steroid binding protein/uncharacterized membrane protein